VTLILGAEVFHPTARRGADGTIPGLDLAQLRRDAARVAARLAA